MIFWRRDCWVFEGFLAEIDMASRRIRRGAKVLGFDMEGFGFWIFFCWISIVSNAAGGYTKQFEYQP
jgi:hypothetical protein